MLAAAERWGGGADERPFLPRAFSVMRRARRPRWSSCSRPSGPGTTPAGRAARRATGCGSPARSGSASRRRATAAARCWSAAASAPRRWRSGRTRIGRRARRCLGFRDAEHAAGASLLRDARVATDDGSRGPQGSGHRPAARGTWARRAQVEVYACGPPGMLEAVRAICAEHDDPGPARARVRHGLRLRRLLRLRRPDERRLRAAVRRRAGARRRHARERRAPMMFLDLADPVDQRVRHVRRDRRPPCVR